MGIRFQKIINDTYKIGDMFIGTDGQIYPILNIVQTLCNSKCKFNNIKYRCDGTKLDIGSLFLQCPFKSYTPNNLIGIPAKETNKRW
jgi:hypothetical protein